MVLCSRKNVDVAVDVGWAKKALTSKSQPESDSRRYIFSVGQIAKNDASTINLYSFCHPPPTLSFCADDHSQPQS